jgi:hypothetical protein
LCGIEVLALLEFAFQFIDRLELRSELVAFRAERENILRERIGFFAERVEFGLGLDGGLLELERRGTLRFDRSFQRPRLCFQLFDLLQGFFVACAPIRVCLAGGWLRRS